MKQKPTKVMIVILLASAFYACTPNKRYCTFVLRSNRCDISKDIKNLCFECNGNACPDIAQKQVYLKRGEKDSCLVSIGNKISDCGKCNEGDSIVVLLRILGEGQ